MTTINPNDYFKRKADVINLRTAITDKQAEIDNLNRRISETKTHVNEINKKLAIEEREMKVPGPLSRVTLTYDQFMEQKRAVTEKEAELPGLNESMSMLNMALTMLKNDFESKSRELQGIKERTAEVLADQAAKQIVELAGGPIKNLINAMVVSGGKHTDNSYYVQQLFLNKLGVSIKNALYQDHTASWLPGLQEANQHIDGLLQLYLSEQAE